LSEKLTVASTDTDTEAGKVQIVIDGQTLTVDEGKLLIEAAIENGIYIPHFCWHPRLRPVAMCRMCLVEIEGVRGLPPACTTKVQDGMQVKTRSELVRSVQQSVLEFLLINHPLDCPVCDKGGECPLQDQTIAFGPGESRYIEEKRHFEKPIPISDLILLDRERCILCARCTRFAQEIALEPDISFVSRGNSTQVLNFADEPFDSYFSGNTVEICPVGALTAVPYRFKARPWDLEEVQSSCVQCAVGCRIAVQSSLGEIVRYRGIDSDSINQGWLCDKGRFSFEANLAPSRLSVPCIRSNGALREASWGEALDYCAQRLEEIAQRFGPQAVGFLGGSRFTNESAYAFARFARGVLGTPNVDAQMDDGLDPSLLLAAPGGGRARLDDLDQASCIVVVGGDLKEELPIVFLRVLGAHRNAGAPIVHITSLPTALSRHADVMLEVPPGALAYTVYALAKAVGETALPDLYGVDKSSLDQAIEILRYPKRPGHPVLVVMRQDLATRPAGLETAVDALADATDAKVLVCEHRSNVFGALWSGLAPSLLPGGRPLHDEETRARLDKIWGNTPGQEAGMGARAMLQAAAEGSLQALVLLGSDPLGDFPDTVLARQALETVPFLVSVDVFRNESNARAHVLFPAPAPGEQSGSVMNLEGRLLWVEQKVRSFGKSRPEWFVAAELAERLGVLSFPVSLEELQRELFEACGVSDIASPSKLVLDSLSGGGIWIGGRFVPPSDLRGRSAGVEEPPKLDRYKMRLLSPRRLYGNGVVNAACEHLASLHGGRAARISVRDADRLGVGDGDRVRLVSGARTALLETRVDPAVPEGCIVVQFNLFLDEGTVAVDGAEVDDPRIGYLIGGEGPICEVSVETAQGAGADIP
jgi:NADH-quinone oxidoreductase subunit G